MKTDSGVIIGARVTIGQVILALVNGSVFMYNYANPDTPLPGEVVGFIAQPIIFAIQVWWANKKGVTT